MYVCVHVCTYVGRYVCMYACMHVLVFVAAGRCNRRSKQTAADVSIPAFAGIVFSVDVCSRLLVYSFTATSRTLVCIYFN